MPKNNQNLKAVKKSICQTLIDSNNLFLKTLGFFCKAFGFKSLIFISVGIVLGIALLYYFIVIKEMTILNMTKVTTPVKMINIQGTIKTVEGKALQPYYIYIVSRKEGPFNSSSGTFEINDIPYNDENLIFVCPSGYFPLEFRNIRDLKQPQSGDKTYTLDIENFSDPLLVVHGQVKDTNFNPVQGKITIDGVSGIIKDGKYCLTGIPKQEKEAFILNYTTNKISRRNFLLENTGTTPKDFTDID